MQKYQMCIDGNYANSASGNWFDRCNPRIVDADSECWPVQR